MLRFLKFLLCAFTVKTISMNNWKVHVGVIYKTIYCSFLIVMDTTSMLGEIELTEEFPATS